MPFGLSSAPPTLQRLMELVLSGLHWTHCLIHLNDIIIFSPTEEEQLNRLNLVLERIAKAGLTLKPSKCQWLQQSVKFLGHILPGDGITVNPEKVRAVQDIPPRNKTDVRSFLGLTSYYGRFTEDYADCAKPLTELTMKK